MWRRRSAWVLRLVVALGILALVIRTAPLGEVVRRATQASPGPFVLALALAGAGSLVLAFRLRLLARALGLSPTLGAAADLNLLAHFYGIFLPGGNVTGGAIRFYRLANSQGRVAAAAGALVWDRLSATLALCLVGLGCWLLAPASKPAWPALAFTLGAVATLGAMALGALASRGAAGTPRLISTAWSKLGPLARRIGGAFSQLAHPRSTDHAAALALSVTAQILGTALYAALAASLGVAVPLVTLGWIRAAVMLVLLLPITISGLGVREGALMVLLSAEGVGEVPAVALGTLVFATTVLAPGLVGGVREAVRLMRAEG